MRKVSADLHGSFLDEGYGAASHVGCVRSSFRPPSRRDREGQGGHEERERQPPGTAASAESSRATTPQATSAACVTPWQRSDARPGTVLDAPDSLPGRPRAQEGARGHRREQPPGSCASRTAPTTTKGRSLPGAASNSFLQKSSGGSAGNPGCSRARRHAPTVAFELLRLLGHLVQRC